MIANVDSVAKCSKCGIVQPISMFRRDGATSQWRRNECKVCHRNDVREWRNRNKERYNARRRRVYREDPVQRERILAEKRRESKKAREKAKFAVLAHYGNRCACCGEATIEFLSVDHMNNDGAAHRRTMSNANLCIWLVQHKFPAGFQVLCMNCSFAKGRFGVCPHQVKL